MTSLPIRPVGADGEAGDSPRPLTDSQLFVPDSEYSLWTGLTATPSAWGEVTLDWTLPPGDWTLFALVRDYRGYPVNRYEGKTIVNYSTSGVTTFTDTGLKEGEDVYYTTFLYFPDIAEWRPSGQASSVVPKDWGLKETLIANLPDFYIYGDESGAVDAFLDGFAWELSLARTETELAKYASDPERVPAPALPLVARNLGVEWSDAIGAPRMRRLLSNIGSLRLQKGTAEGVRQWLEIVTGYETEVDLSPNIVPGTELSYMWGGFMAGGGVGLTDKSGGGWYGKFLLRRVRDAVTNGSTTLTSATANFTDDDIGLYVIGEDIPDGTTIASRNSATSVELSASATGSSTDVNLAILSNGGQALVKNWQGNTYSDEIIEIDAWAPLDLAVDATGGSFDLDFTTRWGTGSVTINYADTASQVETKLDATSAFPSAYPSRVWKYTDNAGVDHFVLNQVRPTNFDPTAVLTKTGKRRGLGPWVSYSADPASLTGAGTVTFSIPVPYDYWHGWAESHPTNPITGSKDFIYLTGGGYETIPPYTDEKFIESETRLTVDPGVSYIASCFFRQVDGGVGASPEPGIQIYYYNWQGDFITSSAQTTLTLSDDIGWDRVATGSGETSPVETWNAYDASASGGGNTADIVITLWNGNSYTFSGVADNITDAAFQALIDAEPDLNGNLVVGGAADASLGYLTIAAAGDFLAEDWVIYTITVTPTGFSAGAVSRTLENAKYADIALEMGFKFTGQRVGFDGVQFEAANNPSQYLPPSTVVAWLSPQRQNLCLNPSFETDTFGWRAFGAETVIRTDLGTADTTLPSDGGDYPGRIDDDGPIPRWGSGGTDTTYVLDATATNTASIGVVTRWSQVEDLTPGDKYRVQVRARSLQFKTGTNFGVAVLGLDDTALQVAVFETDAVTDPVDTQWYTFEVEVTVPSTPSVNGLYVFVGGTNVLVAGPNDVGDQIQVDGVLIEKVDGQYTGYFDGDVPSSTSDYSWVGAEQESQSLWYPGRSIREGYIEENVHLWLPPDADHLFNFNRREYDFNSLIFDLNWAWLLWVDDNIVRSSWIDGQQVDEESATISRHQLRAAGAAPDYTANSSIMDNQPALTFAAGEYYQTPYGSGAAFPGGVEISPPYTIVWIGAAGSAASACHLFGNRTAISTPGEPYIGIDVSGAWRLDLDGASFITSAGADTNPHLLVGVADTTSALYVDYDAAVTSGAPTPADFGYPIINENAGSVGQEFHLAGLIDGAITADELAALRQFAFNRFPSIYNNTY